MEAEPEIKDNTTDANNPEEADVNQAEREVEAEPVHKEEESEIKLVIDDSR